MSSSVTVLPLMCPNFCSTSYFYTACSFCFSSHQKKSRGYDRTQRDYIMSIGSSCNSYIYPCSPNITLTSSVWCSILMDIDSINLRSDDVTMFSCSVDVHLKKSMEHCVQRWTKSSHMSSLSYRCLCNEKWRVLYARDGTMTHSPTRTVSMLCIIL